MNNNHQHQRQYQHQSNIYIYIYIFIYFDKISAEDKTSTLKVTIEPDVTRLQGLVTHKSNVGLIRLELYDIVVEMEVHFIFH